MTGREQTVLVTGGCGFIGSHTALALEASGYRVRVLDALRPPVHSQGEVPARVRHLDVIVGDVTDSETLLEAMDGVDYVMHLAAYQDYLTDYSTFLDVNTTSTARIYELIAGHQLGVRKVVLASSQSVYGESGHRCAEHGLASVAMRSASQLRHGRWDIECPTCHGPTTWSPATEDQARPVNAYGASKLALEVVALTLGRQAEIPTTALRYSITNGRGQSPTNAYSGICRIFVQRALRGEPLVAYEDGLQVRDYVFVEDVVAANLLALQDPRTDDAVFNVGGSNVTTVVQYAEVVREVLDRDVPIEVPQIYRFGDTRHVVSSAARLEALGWRATADLPTIVADYARWYLQEADGAHASVDATAHMLDLGVLRSVEGTDTSGGAR